MTEEIDPEYEKFLGMGEASGPSIYADVKHIRVKRKKLTFWDRSSTRRRLPKITKPRARWKKIDGDRKEQYEGVQRARPG